MSQEMIPELKNAFFFFFFPCKTFFKGFEVLTKKFSLLIVYEQHTQVVRLNCYRDPAYLTLLRIIPSAILKVTSW